MDTGIYFPPSPVDVYELLTSRRWLSMNRPLADGFAVNPSSSTDSTAQSSRLSRRQLLGGGLAGLTVALAGCLGGSDDDNGDDDNGDGDEGDDPNGEHPGDAFELAGDGAAAFRDWLIAAVVDGDDADFICEYIDFEAAVDQGVTQFDSVRRGTASLFGVEPEAISGELVVVTPDGFELIHLGEFDTESVISAFEAQGHTVLTEREGYTILGQESDGTDQPAGAVGDDAVLDTPWATEHIDAVATGEGRLEETDEDVALLFDLLPSGVRTGVRYHPNLDDTAVSGEVGVEYDGDTVTRSVRTFVFETESDATIERARDIIDSGAGSEEVFTEEIDGRAVIVDYAPPTSG